MQIEKWRVSDYVSEAQLAEWRANDANDAVNSAPFEERWRWLEEKAQARGFRDWLRYARRLGVSVHGEVVELGAGTFWLTSLLSSLPDVERVSGIELSEARVAAFADISLKMFGGDGRKIRWVIGDMHRIDMADRSVDLVACDATLHHADNLVAVLREARRVLKPGGWFIATREHMVAAYRPSPTFDERTPENGSAMYYYRGGWRSAFLNGRYEAIRMCRFYEDMTVKGIFIPRHVQPLFRPLMLPIWLRSYPKVAIAARRPA